MDDPGTKCLTVTVSEAAEMLGMNRATIDRALAAGTFPIQALRLGGWVRFSRAALLAWIDGSPLTPPDSVDKKENS